MATVEETTWHPIDVFSDTPNMHKDFALIILNQPLELRASLYTKLWSNFIYKVAADGGANRLHDVNTSSQEKDLDLDLIIGDLDSLLPDVKKYWDGKDVQIIKDSDQNSTDFTKAVRHIWSPETGPKSKPLNIVALGGLGGRVDQGISILHHLYTFQKDYDSGKIFLLSSEGITFVLKAGRHRIKAKERFGGVGLGRHIGIVPLKEPSVITTRGLEWDVEDWETEFGGQISTSNHVVEEWVVIETTKDVIFTIDLDFTSPNSS